MPRQTEDGDLPERILEALRGVGGPAYVNYSGTEVSVRCPWCGDSKKNPKSAHLFIKMQPPYPLFCQRCNTAGVLGPEALRDLKIHDTRLAASVLRAGGSAARRTPQGASRDPWTPLTRAPAPRGGVLEERKLEYLSGRVGRELLASEAIGSYRAVLSLRAFLEDNGVGVVTEEPDVLSRLEKHAVGFVSRDGSHVILRAMDPEAAGFRYHNYNVFGDRETSRRTYAVASRVNAMCPVLTVAIAEGIFDVLGVHSHLYERGEGLKDHVFLAVNGKGYNHVFQQLAREGFLELDIRLYSDTDVGLDFYRQIKERSPLLARSKVEVYYNRAAKDFGVPADMIDVRRTTI